MSKRWSRLLLATAASVTLVQQASAESIKTALASAYNHNATLNAQRAATRAVDEQIVQAKAGKRRVSLRIFRAIAIGVLVWLVPVLAAHSQQVESSSKPVGFVSQLLLRLL